MLNRALTPILFLIAFSAHARVLDVHSEIRVARSGELTVTERITLEGGKDARLEREPPREARAVNRLRHPNIIAVYDFGQLADGRFFLSMEYAEGQSVYQTLKRDDHFSIPRALNVAGQLAYAVHHAHSRGVVHRDLKPDNLILVGDEELLKVLDFGVAKIVAAEYDAVVFSD